ncbi:MAG: hypothetical protein IJ401_06510 [Oscillospiraceae bacterium]|nr:hypothetical protein [Oscillospiraceae bacterium]
MAFVCEIIPSEDIEYVRSLGIKDWSGHDLERFFEGISEWSIDRNRQAFLVRLGGGYKDMPYFAAFWYEGCEIRIETPVRLFEDNEGRKIRKITGISIPKELYSQKEEICNLIIEAYLAMSKYYNSSTITEIHCEPKIKER